MAAGAEFDRGLPRFFWPFGGKGLSGNLERELRFAVCNEAFDTGVDWHDDMTAKVEVNLSIFF